MKVTAILGTDKDTVLAPDELIKNFQMTLKIGGFIKKSEMEGEVKVIKDFDLKDISICFAPDKRESNES